MNNRFLKITDGIVNISSLQLNKTDIAVSLGKAGS
jgi:hypothetical protein